MSHLAPSHLGPSNRAQPNLAQPNFAQSNVTPIGAARRADIEGSFALDAARGAAPASHPRHRAPAAEARGFALYVGLDEAKALEDGVALGELVAALRKLAAELAPSATTHAAVALAPAGAGGRDVDVVRLALGEPEAHAARRRAQEEREARERREADERSRRSHLTHRPGGRRELVEEGIEGVTVDTTRRRILIDGENVHATYTEYELLQALVLREGRAVSRAELLDLVWRAEDGERPSDRTIDVHVGRLRARLGGYADIVRTVRGVGYRFDRHADVEILLAPGRSPERF
ncbi:Phosphate regulon transcriptional regulatory protein PhoB [Pseudoclavibacter triregionum]|nr:Phosphate regulon transcriptional regulatory protein PhoB [Pseudoclavibacter triregionum]